MANQRHAFKHRDITRTIKAVRAAGINVRAVTVNPHTGEVTVTQDEDGPGKTNPLDRVLDTAKDGQVARVEPDVRRKHA